MEKQQEKAEMIKDQESTKGDGTILGKTITGEPRKQKVSGSYTVKAFAENAKKLKELGYITNEDLNKLKEIHNKAVIEHQKTQLGTW